MTDTTTVAEALLFHADFVRRLAHSLAGAEGEDLAQDTLVAALQSPPGKRGNLRGWLATVAANLRRNHQRSDARRRRREQAETLQQVPSALEIAAREEVRQRVVAAVLQLPEALRDVVLLRFYEGLDSRQIGARLQRPDSTVRTQLQQALAKLRRRLDGERGERRAWAVPLGWWGKAPAAALLCKVAWPLRVAVAAVLLLVAGWFVLPRLSPAPGSPSPVPVAAAPAEKEPQSVESPASDRLEATSVSDPAHGPEELWGRVVRAIDDSPVAGADVQLQRCEADEFDCLDAEFGRRVQTLASSRSDDTGHFSFQVARAWRHRLVVRVFGCAPVTRYGCTGGAEVVVRVAASAEIEGVVRTQQGVAVAGADISVTAIDTGHRLAASTTAPDGTFSCGDLPSGEVVIAVAAPDLVPESQRTALTSGDVRQVEFALAAGQTVRGTVKDFVTGLPIADAEVSGDYRFATTTRTAADGAYLLRGFGRETVLRVRADGYVGRQHLVPKGDGEPTVDFALIHGGSLRGRFVTADGEPVAKVYAAVGCTYMFMGSAGEREWLPLAVGADGRFERRGIDLKLYHLYVRGEGLGARTFLLPRIPAVEQTVDLGDIVLRTEALLEGRVVDAEGRPIAGAQVELLGCNADALDRFAPAPASAGLPWPAGYMLPREQFIQFTNVDATFRRSRSVTAVDGSFRFGGLAGGSYHLNVRLQKVGRATESGPFVLQDGELRTGIEVRAVRGPTIRGRVVLSDGSAPDPAVRTYVLAIDKNGRHATGTVDEKGAFAIELSAPGEFTLFAERVPAGWAAAPLRGVEAPSDAVEYVLRPAAMVCGRVVDAKGQGVLANVTCWIDGGPFAQAHATEPDGSFAIEVSPDYVGRITARGAGGRPGSAEVRDVAAGARDLLLQLK